MAWTKRTFVSKVISLLFNTLSRFVIAFLPRSKHLLISWLQSPSTVILDTKKIKSITEARDHGRCTQVTRVSSLTLTNCATLGRFLKLSPCYFPHLKYGDSDPASWSLGETAASFTQLVNTCATLAFGLPGQR